LPRSLLDRQYWKASEWRGWLLHYAVPCLTGILPQRYLDHLCLLVNSVYLLLKETVVNRDIATASDQLTEFVVVVQSLYGAQAMTFNVHQLLHLAKSVQKLGPLWSHSTFIFESGNGQLLKLVSGSNGVPLQILERF
ncbi:PrC protein, putative, partial [Ixodes scapularis]